MLEPVSFDDANTSDVEVGVECHYNFHIFHSIKLSRKSLSLPPKKILMMLFPFCRCHYFNHSHSRLNPILDAKARVVSLFTGISVFSFSISRIRTFDVKTEFA